MNECNGSCDQGRRVCTCKGLEMDFGKNNRQYFLDQEKENTWMERFSKWMLLFAALYFLGHIAYALYNL